MVDLARRPVTALDVAGESPSAAGASYSLDDLAGGVEEAAMWLQGAGGAGNQSLVDQLGSPSDLLGSAGGLLGELGRSLFGPEDPDRAEIPEAPERGPSAIPPIYGPELPEPGPKSADKVVQEHLFEYVALVESAFDDPGLGQWDFGKDSAALSKKLVAGWVQIGAPAQDTRAGIQAVEDALHAAAMGALLAMHEPKLQDSLTASFGRSKLLLLETHVYSRIASPTSYGLRYPTAATLGVPGVDVAAAMAAGRDQTEAIGADGESIPAEVSGKASPEERARHLAELLKVEPLPAEHLAGAHEDVEVLYDGRSGDVIAGAGLPATSAEVYRQLQEKAAFANQRDNANRTENPDGGTCNFTAVAMAMGAAGVTAPYQYRGVVLEGMQLEERLIAIAYQDGMTNLLSSDVWGHVVRACGGRFEDLKMGGQSTWEQWQSVQTQHLDLGHGVVVSNNGHVLRIQSVDELGLTIDDPYSRGTVKETESHAGQIAATLHHEWPEPEEGEKPPAPVPDRQVSLPAWKQGGAVWGSYDEATETFSDAMPEDTWKPRLCAQAAADTETSPEQWAAVGKVQWSGNRDRSIGEKNSRDRDQGGADYEKGDDTTWSRDAAVGHYMNGVWAIYR